MKGIKGSGGSEVLTLLRLNRNALKDLAGVVELADAPDSKSGGGNPVRVQFSPPAPNFIEMTCGILCLPTATFKNRVAPAVFFNHFISHYPYPQICHLKNHCMVT